MLVARRHHRDPGRDAMYQPPVRFVARAFPAPFLDADDIGQLDQRRQRFRVVGQVVRAHACLVQHQRQRRRRRDDLVVIERHRRVLRQRPGERRKDQQHVGAGSFRVTRMLGRFQRTFGVDAADEDRLVTDARLRNLDHPLLFGARQCEVFAGVAVDQHADDAIGGHSVGEMPRQRGLVDRSVERHWADGGGVDAVEGVGTLRNHQRLQ